VCAVQIYACKVINISGHKRDPRILPAIDQEINVLGFLKNAPNIVQWHDDVSYDISKCVVHLHMDYYSGGDLRGLIEIHTDNG
jgi:serine/threonine protein kinase